MAPRANASTRHETLKPSMSEADLRQFTQMAEEIISLRSSLDSLSQTRGVGAATPSLLQSRQQESSQQSECKSVDLHS